MVANHLSSAVCCVTKAGSIQGLMVASGTDDIFSDDLTTSELYIFLLIQMAPFAHGQSDSRGQEDKADADLFLREH